MLGKHKKQNQIDMTTGGIVRKQVLFIIPLMMTSFLQLFYNAVDIIVVGKFAGTTALSAVGSTSALINLLVNVFIGLSVGTSVTMSLYFGAKDETNIHRTVHTATAIATVAGIGLIFIGFFMSPVLLQWMDTPSDVIDQAVLYMRIFFLGMPFNMIYNFCAAMLRAVGDTKRPLQFLAIAGVVNVILNLIFVVVFHMDVAGVALATIIAQAISMVLVLQCFIRSKGAMKLEWRKIRIYKAQLLMMVRIGLPAGIQGAFFSVSNVLIQSSINSFGAVAMAGNAASSNLEGFMFTAMNCVHQSAVTFAGQNLGAGNYKRVRQNLYYCFGIVTAVGVGMCTIFALLGKHLLHLYTDNPEAIDIGLERLLFFCSCYFLCGVMDVMTGHLRGLGYSVVPMIVTFCGVCVLRVVWVFAVFRQFPSLGILYVSYPVTWIVSLIVLYIYYMTWVNKRIDKNIKSKKRNS